MSDRMRPFQLRPHVMEVARPARRSVKAWIWLGALALCALVILGAIAWTVVPSYRVDGRWFTPRAHPVTAAVTSGCPGLPVDADDVTAPQTSYSELVPDGTPLSAVVCEYQHTSAFAPTYPSATMVLTGSAALDATDAAALAASAHHIHLADQHAQPFADGNGACNEVSPSRQKYGLVALHYASGPDALLWWTEPRCLVDDEIDNGLRAAVSPPDGHSMQAFEKRFRAAIAAGQGTSAG